MTQKKDSLIKSIVRAGIIILFSRKIPLYLVTEYPKSGASWFCRMLSAVIKVGIPPSNRIPSLMHPSIIHGHYLRMPGMKNVIVVWRDGRDVMVSWYHHCLFYNDRGNHVLVSNTRQKFPAEDYGDVRGNLTRFIKYVFESQSYPRFSWSKFVKEWINREGVVYVKYEDLLVKPSEELIRVVNHLGGYAVTREEIDAVVSHFSFANQTGRRAGQEDKNSFHRKGIAGDWANHFDSEARVLFDYYAGDELIALGYEKDRGWVRKH